MSNLFLLWFGASLRLFRSRRNLLLENFVLRQQLAVLKRRHRGPSLGTFDKLFWVVTRQVWPGWKQSPIIVTPETRLIREGIGTHLDFYNFVLGTLAPFHVPRRIRIVACPEASAFPSSLWIVYPPLHRSGVVPHWIRNADRHELAGVRNKGYHGIGIDGARHRYILPEAQNTVPVNEDQIVQIGIDP